MIPPRLTKPTVGFIPTTPQSDAGEMIDPSVSVPTATAHKLAATATAEPALEPEGLRSSAYGFFVSPPRALQPLVELLALKFAHSLRLVLPSSTAPAARSLRTRVESCGAPEPSRASEPAVVIILSPVS